MLERLKSVFKRRDAYNETLRSAEARLSAYESKLLKFDVKAWEQQAARDRRSLESVHLECWKRIMTLHSWAASDLLEIAYTQSVLISKRGWLRLCLCAAAIQVLHQRAKASEGWRRVFLGISEEREVEFRASGKFPVLPSPREGTNASVSSGSTADLEARLPLDIDRFCATSEELVRDFSICKRLQKKISRITDRLAEIDADFTAQQPTLRELPKEVRKATLSDLVNAEVKLSTEEEDVAKEISEVLDSLGSLSDALPIHPAAPWFSHLLVCGEFNTTQRIIEAYPPTASLLASDVRRGVANAQEMTPTAVSPQLLLTLSTIIYHGHLLKHSDFNVNNISTPSPAPVSTRANYYTPVGSALSEVHSALLMSNSIALPSVSSIPLFCRLHELIERDSALIARRSLVYKRFERLIADQRTKDGRLLQRGLQRMLIDKDFDGGMYAFDLPRFLTFGPGAAFAAETRAAMGIVSPETVASARFVNSHSPRIVLADGIDGGNSGDGGHTTGSNRNASGTATSGGGGTISIEMGLMGNSSPPKKSTSNLPPEDSKDAYNNSKHTIVARRANPEVAAIRYGRTSSSSLISTATAATTTSSSLSSFSSSTSSSSSSSLSSSKSPQSLNKVNNLSRHKGAMPTPNVVRMFLSHLVKEVATNNNLIGMNSSSSVDAHTLEQQRKALRNLIDRLVFARLHSFVHAGIDVAPLQPWSASESPSIPSTSPPPPPLPPLASTQYAQTISSSTTTIGIAAVVKNSLSTDSEVAIPIASSITDPLRISGNPSLAYLGGPQRPVGSAADVMLRRDKIWQRKRVSVSRMTAAEIGLLNHFVTPLPSDLPNAKSSPFDVSAALLSSLDNLFIPSQICKVIVAAVDAAIVEAKARLIAAATLKNEGEGSIASKAKISPPQGDVTAEDLIPLLIYISSRSSWQRPHATLSFVSAYGIGPGFTSSSSSSPSTLGGRESYLFTVLQSCVSWVCQRSAEEINGTMLQSQGSGGSSAVSDHQQKRSSVAEDPEFAKQLFGATGVEEDNNEEEEEERELEGDDDDGEYVSLMLVDEFERDIEDSGVKLKETIKHQAHLEGALEMFS